MEFMKELKEMEIFQMTEDIKPLHIRKFYPIEVRPNLFLSIQASEFAYCKPRETFKDLNKYTHWEFAIRNNDEFFKVSDILPDFKSLSEVEIYETGPVYAEVPTDLVNEVYLAFK